MVTYRSEFAWPHGGPKTYAIEVTYTDPDDGHNLTARCKEKTGGSDVAVLKGALLWRPSTRFFTKADDVSAEVYSLAKLFCESNGEATRIQHPKLVGDSCVKFGGFLNIESLEVKPSHQKCDLGLRVLHEVLTLLKDEWSLAVVIPVMLPGSFCEWKENSRVDRRDRSPEALALMNEGSLKVQRQFIRFGFVQTGRTLGLTESFFLTSNMYFSGHSDPSDNMIGWLTKEQASRVEIHKEPDQHESKGLDKELRSLIHKASAEVFAFLSSLKSDVTGTSPTRARTPVTAAVTGMILLNSETITKIEDLVHRGASIHNSRALFVAAALKGLDICIFQTLIRLGGNVNLQDEFGNTPLHTAAASLNARVVDYLVGSAGSDMSIVNFSNQTPLQAAQKKAQALDDHFKTFHARAIPFEHEVNPKIECLTALMPPSMRELLVDGWLSPRMRNVLTVIASAVSYDIKNEIDSLEGGSFKFEYIPPHIRRKLHGSKSFIPGWGYLWETLEQILKAGLAPAVRRVKEWIESGGVANVDLNTYRNFVENGGRIEFAVDALLQTTQDVLENCSGEWEYSDLSGIDETLPHTVFDRSFDVAWIVCINRGGGDMPGCQRGPYSFFL